MGSQTESVWHFQESCRSRAGRVLPVLKSAKSNSSPYSFWSLSSVCPSILFCPAPWGSIAMHTSNFVMHTASFEDVCDTRTCLKSWGRERGRARLFFVSEFGGGKWYS